MQQIHVLLHLYGPMKGTTSTLFTTLLASSREDHVRYLYCHGAILLPILLLTISNAASSSEEKKEKSLFISL